MSLARPISLLALIAGLALIGWGITQGQIDVHLVLIIPVLTGQGPLAALGMLLVIGGLFGWILTGVPTVSEPPSPPPSGPRQPSQAPGEGAKAETSARGGGVILIGPIPIAWGSDRSSLLAIIVAAIVLILVATGLMLYL